MTIVLAIDPGNVKSGWVAFDTTAMLPLQFGKHDNEYMLRVIDKWTIGADAATLLAVEQIKSYGMRVGDTVFETCVQSGRMMQRWLENTAQEFDQILRVPRTTAKSTLGLKVTTKDKDIRRAIIDRYGGDEATKKGGVLHGVAGDVWAALAVAFVAATASDPAG